MDDKDSKAYVFSRIFMLANRLQALGDRMDETVTVKQWLMIAIIMRSGGTPSLGEIAEQSGNSRQNTKKMAVILQKQGFLTLKHDPQDRRVVRVAVTAHCLDYFRNRGQQEQQFIADLFAGFEAERLNGLQEGIARLMTNLAAMEQADNTKQMDKEHSNEEETE